jgi:hypothetical protein
MKTRQEILYEFLLALSVNPSVVDGDMSTNFAVEAAWELANALTDRYFEGLS